MKKIITLLACLLLLFTGCEAKAPDRPVPEGALDSLSRLYYDSLSTKEKNCYLDMYDTLQKGEKSCRIQKVSPEEAQRAHDALLCDHPEVYWTQYYWYDSDPGGITYKPEYIFTKEEREDIDVEIGLNTQQLETGLSELDDFGKARKLFERTVLWTTYDKDAGHNQTIYGSIAQRRSVCAGTARMYQYLLHRQGIPAVYVVGTSPQGIPHGWVMAELNGEWSHFDPTAAASSPGQPVYCHFSFFGMTDEDIKAQGYVVDTMASLPKADSMQNSYYFNMGTLLDTYSRDKMETAIENALMTGQPNAFVRFEDPADLQTAVTDLFENGGIFSIMQKNRTGRKVSYALYPETGCMDILFG